MHQPTHELLLQEKTNSVLVHIVENGIRLTDMHN
jgi:hypothetical protein